MSASNIRNINQEIFLPIRPGRLIKNQSKIELSCTRPKVPWRIWMEIERKRERPTVQRNFVSRKKWREQYLFKEVHLGRTNFVFFLSWNDKLRAIYGKVITFKHVYVLWDHKNYQKNISNWERWSFTACPSLTHSVTQFKLLFKLHFAWS